MNRISCTFAGAAIAISMLAAPSVATAASDYFLKLEGLDGEPGQTIEVQSWSWGTSRAGTSRETQKDSVRNMKANEGAQSARNLNSSKSNAYREASPAERAAMRCLSELPVPQREVVVLKIWHNYTFEEIGELLEV